VRYYLDEDVKPEVAGIGRNLGLDIVSSHEVGRNALLMLTSCWPPRRKVDVS